MTEGEPASGAPPEDAIAVSREVADRHIRTDRQASMFWAAIFGAGLLVLLGLVFAGSFDGHDPVLAAVVIGLLIALPLYGALSSTRTQTQTLQSLQAPPQRLRLTSAQNGRSKTERRVELHDGTSVVATARIRRPRALTSLPVAVDVLVFGAVAPNQRVVCVSPRLGLVATLDLMPDHA